MRRRILSNSRRRSLILPHSFAALLLLLTSQNAFAEPFSFQDVAGSGAAQTPQGGGATGQVQTVDLGDVTGTVCDCGEVGPAPGGAPGVAPVKSGFPRFPLLAMAAGPGVICFTVICGTEPPPRRPPPETPVPEPLTAATLAAGLAALAGLRARRRRDA